MSEHSTDIGSALLDIPGVAALLNVSKATVERYLAQDGLPYLDLGHHHPRRRPRRLLRFEREQVLEWARAHHNNGSTTSEQD